MNLTEHFTLEELLHSDDANQHGIDNTQISDQVRVNLQTLANGLEQVRALIGFPMNIDSGYRCPELNALVGGVPDSAHLTGFAADFVSPGYGAPIDIVNLIQSSQIKFDQAIQEGSWVHISFAPAMRQEVLTAHFNAEHKATYTKGN